MLQASHGHTEPSQDRQQTASNSVYSDSTGVGWAWLDRAKHGDNARFFRSGTVKAIGMPVKDSDTRLGRVESSRVHSKQQGRDTWFDEEFTLGIYAGAGAADGVSVGYREQFGLLGRKTST